MFFKAAFRYNLHMIKLSHFPPGKFHHVLFYLILTYFLSRGQPLFCFPSLLQLPFLGTSYKWSHVTCMILHLASFTYNIFKNHPCYTRMCSFLCLNGIPVHRYTTFFLIHSQVMELETVSSLGVL